MVSLVRRLSRTGLLIGCVGMLAVGFVVWDQSGRVVIAISPPSEPVSTEFTVTVSQNSDDMVGFVTSYASQYAHDFDASGKKQGEGRSQGVVRLINKSAAAQPLVATTRFLSKEGVLFRLSQRTTVPANSEVSADVYADGVGPTYDIPPTTFAIPGLPPTRQVVVFAVSDTPMTGGDGQVIAVSQGDIAHARNTLINTAVDIASVRMIDEARTASKMEFDGQLFDYDIGSLVLSAGEGATQQKFAGEVEVFVRGVFFPRRDIERRAFEQLQNQVSEHEVLLGMRTKDIVYALDSYDDASKKAVIRVFAQGDKRRVKQGSELSSDTFAGKPLEDVNAIAHRVVPGAHVSVRGGLPWGQKIPTDESRISVVIE